MLQHTLKPSLIQRAFSVTVMYIRFFITGTVLLAIFEPNILLSHLIFEEISALSTVGLSMGITPYLGDIAKTILVFSMYIGRIGSITIILALVRRKSNVQYTYSHANVLIG
jgi:trk system potassium uptake protein TrkH